MTTKQHYQYVPPPQFPPPIYGPAPNRQPIAVKGPKHVAHALMTLVTGGLWLPVWIVIAFRNKQKPIY